MMQFGTQHATWVLIWNNEDQEEEQRGKYRSKGPEYTQDKEWTGQNLLSNKFPLPFNHGTFGYFGDDYRVDDVQRMRKNMRSRFAWVTGRERAISNRSIASASRIDNATSPMIFNMFAATTSGPSDRQPGFMHSRVNRDAYDIKKPAVLGYKFSGIPTALVFPKTHIVRVVVQFAHDYRKRKF